MSRIREEGETASHHRKRAQGSIKPSLMDIMIAQLLRHKVGKLGVEKGSPIGSPRVHIFAGKFRGRPQCK